MCRPHINFKEIEIVKIDYVGFSGERRDLAN
jgi:hypothetical protein